LCKLIGSAKLRSLRESKVDVTQLAYPALMVGPFLPASSGPVPSRCKSGQMKPLTGMLNGAVIEEALSARQMEWGQTMDFVALDVETANADMSSICQIGLACFTQEKALEEWKTYVDPEDYFDGMNISIHGIDEAKVKGAPTLPGIADQIFGYLDGRVAVCHTHFDRVAMRQAFSKYGLRSPTCAWLDSARVARRTWKEFAWKGYGLDSVCSALGYEFTHHDALEDAKAAAHILLTAIEKTGIDVDGWHRRVKQPIDLRCTDDIARGGNPEGPLYGEVIVFTGRLDIPREEAKTMAAEIGCSVKDGVTKATTILVVGDQDIRNLAGHEKSSKHRKAEEMMREGQAIRILMESDFKELVSCLG
jgi:DNA polymerase-3 subunit epsilon